MKQQETTAIIIFNKQGKILLQKRDNIPTIKDPGKWDFWGGYCEDVEDAKKIANNRIDKSIHLTLR